MKYFVQKFARKSVWSMTATKDGPIVEVTRDFAKTLYRRHVINDGLDVNETMIHQMTEYYLTQGEKVKHKESYEVWGEEVSDKVLFKLRLRGDISSEILS